MGLNPEPYKTEGSEPVKSTHKSYCLVWINSMDSCSECQECLQELDV